MRIFRSERLKRRDWPAIPSIFGAIARRDLPNKNYSFQIVDGPADYLVRAQTAGEDSKGQTALPAFSSAIFSLHSGQSRGLSRAP